MEMKSNYIFNSIWKVLSNNEEILSYLNLDIYTDKKVVRQSILPNLPMDYNDLPKITILGKVNGRECPSMPFMDEIQFQIHALTYDESYSLNLGILEHIRELIDTETFPLESDSGLCYWSGFWWLNEGKLPTISPDTYDYYHTYKTELYRKFSKRHGA
jgi:hypothetical protein